MRGCRKPAWAAGAARSSWSPRPGQVLPCHAAQTLPGSSSTMSRERSLADIWRHGSAFEAFRGTSWMKEPCRSCERREIDFGGCRCQAFAVAGDAAATDPACQPLAASSPASEPRHRCLGKRRAAGVRVPACRARLMQEAPSSRARRRNPGASSRRGLYEIRLSTLHPSSRKPLAAIRDRKRHCPAFVTIPDNASGISGTTLGEPNKRPWPSRHEECTVFVVLER